MTEVHKRSRTKLSPESLRRKSLRHPFAVTWSLFLPTYSQRELNSRLEEESFWLATHLVPENVIRSLRSLHGQEKFRRFFLSSAESQRAAEVEVIRDSMRIDSELLRVIGDVPAEAFVPQAKRRLAYWNGVVWTKGLNGSTPPWLAAFGAQHLSVKEGESVLDLGYGNGYTGAVFSVMVGDQGRVVGLEIEQRTVRRAKKIARLLGLEVEIVTGDVFDIPRKLGSFDVMWPGCATAALPKEWSDMLSDNGRMALFRPLNVQEWHYARSRKSDTWASRCLSYEIYRRRWWRDVCMEILKKESSELIPIARLYEMDNTPFWHPVYGTTEQFDWNIEIGDDAESKVLRAIASFERRRSP